MSRGSEAKADYRAIPAVVFTDPQVASAGDTNVGGARHGLEGRRQDLADVDVRAAEAVRVREALRQARPPRPGRSRRRSGPEAGEWLGQLTLAIRAEVPLDVLVDTIQPYPTFSEAIFFAARELAG